MSAIDSRVHLLANPYVGSQNVGKVILVGRKVDYLSKAKDFEGFVNAGKLSRIQGEIEEVIGEKQVKIRLVVFKKWIRFYWGQDLSSVFLS